MGNQHSSSPSIDVDRLRPFSRTVGSLGLNRNELDKRTQNSGLYSNCQWDDKAVRRLIADGRLAARMKGDECCKHDTQECPICFLCYNEVNITKCCNANICTECYLQVRPQKEKQSTCPFCNCDNLSVAVVKKKKNDFDAVIPSMSSSSTSSTASFSTRTSNSNSSSVISGCKYKGSSPVVTTGKKKSTASVAPHSLSIKKHTGFGSNLENNERFKMMKKRSESFASNEGSRTPVRESEIIKSIAMTTEERKRLEDEMRAQHYHPLVLDLEAEAQERRLENDRTYRNSTGNRSNARSQRTADLLRNHNLVDAANSINHMVALEAAIMFSMGEDRSTSSLSSNDGEDNSNNNTENEPASNSSNEGFPLLRSILTGQTDNNGTRRGRGQLMRSNLGSLSAARNLGIGGAALDTAALMMRGISEEEQISMAIAASLQDQSDNNHNGVSGEDHQGHVERSNINSDDTKMQHDSIQTSSPSSSSSIALVDSERQGIGSNRSADEASTITELARVVTDSTATNGKLSSGDTVSNDTI